MLREKMEILKGYCRFEVAFGRNDVLWFKCDASKTEMILYNIFTQLLQGCSSELFETLLKLLKQ